VYTEYLSPVTDQVTSMSARVEQGGKNPAEQKRMKIEEALQIVNATSVPPIEPERLLAAEQNAKLGQGEATNKLHKLIDSLHPNDRSPIIDTIVKKHYDALFDHAKATEHAATSDVRVSFALGYRYVSELRAEFRSTFGITSDEFDSSLTRILQTESTRVLEEKAAEAQ